MSVAAPPKPSGQPSPAKPVAVGFEPQVVGESQYDRVSSFLMAIVFGAAIVVGWNQMMLWTDRAYDARVTSPLEIIEVSGGGGGTPEGEAGSKEEVNVAGAEVADQASNNPEEASEFEEKSVAETPAVMLDAAAEAGENMSEVDVASVMPSGGPVATGKRSSKLGTGGPGLGFGPGDGGVRREQRWVIIYKPGQTLDEYARQLDALGVELGTVVGNQMVYASHFSNPNPTRRTGAGDSEHRLYFVWSGGTRKASDVGLLKKAGIDVGEAAIFQFYPAAIENVLAQLEVIFKGRQPAEIKRTRFEVVPRGASYAFVVQSQDPLRN
ncbi:MAG TPA: hypothetical protein VGY53_05650 [Isosphaeraceae bacterium]|nr:hypothetical protein [Isosphaeraceae bacterium]